MEGKYSEEQKNINGNFNEAYDLVVESLFGHQNSIRVPWPSGPQAIIGEAMAIRPPFLFGESLIDTSASVQGVRSAARRKTA